MPAQHSYAPGEFFNQPSITFTTQDLPNATVEAAIADVCLLEDIDFTEGIQDMAEYWKHPYGDFIGTRKMLI